MASDEELIASVFADTVRLHEDVAANAVRPLLAAVEAVAGAFARGGKVLAFGNGGSAADSQHLAAELVGRFMAERKALPAIALTTDTSVLTSIGNDYAFERVFARQIEALGTRDDVAFAISTSGQSPNVVAGIRAARSQGLKTVALTGSDGGAVGATADIHLNVPTKSAARAQEVHRTLLHVICELVERRIANV